MARRPVDGFAGDVVDSAASKNNDANDDYKQPATSGRRHRRPGNKCIALPDVTAYCTPCASSTVRSTSVIVDDRKNDTPIHDVIVGENHRLRRRAVTTLCDDFAAHDFDTGNAVQSLYKAGKNVRRKIVTWYRDSAQRRLDLANETWSTWFTWLPWNEINRTFEDAASVRRQIVYDMRLLAGVLNTAQRLVINEYECDALIDPLSLSSSSSSLSSSSSTTGVNCRGKRHRNPKQAVCESMRRLDRDFRGRHGLYPLYRHFERLHLNDVGQHDEDVTSSTRAVCDRLQPSSETALSADISRGPVDGRHSTNELINATATARRKRAGRTPTSRRRPWSGPWSSSSSKATKQCERDVRRVMRVWRSRDRFTNRFARWMTVIELLDVFVHYVEFLQNFIVGNSESRSRPSSSSTVAT